MRIKKKTVFGWVAAFFGLAALILTITLLAMTVNREVEQEEYVVSYDTYNMRFTGGVKEQGRYTTGVGVRFYKFLRTLRPLSLGDIHCLTKDKVELELKVKLQIHMLRDELIPVVLRQFSDADSHTSFLRHICRSVIISTCLDYDAYEYYSMRAEVDAKMFQDLQDAVNNHSYGSSVDFFQLSNIALPLELTEVITEKQNIEQEIITARNDRENALITATTELLQAEKTAAVNLLEANTTANILRNEAQQLESILLTEWTNRAEAYADVVSTLGLNEKQFLEYLDAEVLRLVGKVVV